MHSTNYYNTFIEIAEDSPTTRAVVPPVKGESKSVANLQFELLYDHPYQYTSDDILFEVFAIRKEVSLNDKEPARQEFFAKGQPCFRASPLSKRYGWGVHSNPEGKIAIFGVETKQYQQLVGDQTLTKVKAMRSKRK